MWLRPAAGREGEGEDVRRRHASASTCQQEKRLPELRQVGPTGHLRRCRAACCVARLKPVQGDIIDSVPPQAQRALEDAEAAKKSR